MTIRINPRALLRPLCWLREHVWADYLVINAWTREGRFCRRCRKEQFVRYGVEFTDDNETIHVRTDWNGTERFRWVSHGEGTKNDPISYERVVTNAGEDE